jgi:hypothetical protein
MFMGRAGTIGVVAAFADGDPLPSLEGFIAHQLNAAPSLEESLDEQTQQGRAQVQRGPPGPIEHLVVFTQMGGFF